MKNNKLWNYKIIRLLSSGSFGYVYEAINSVQGNPVAIKFVIFYYKQLLDIHQSQLQNQFIVSKKFSGICIPLLLDGFPKIYDYCIEDKYRVLIMELLGKPIHKLFLEKQKQFSLKTVCLLSNQFITRLQCFHKKGFIHRDLKPDNFLMGIKQNKIIAHLIDFGMAMQYLDENLEHIECKKGFGQIGNEIFCSIAGHRGLQQSRKDDLQSIGYILIYLAKGSLPWEGCKRDFRKIGDIKQAISIQQLCKDLPYQFMNFMHYVYGLQFNQQPQYDYLKSIFCELMEDLGYKWDMRFDWQILKS